ncbi:MAG: DUF4331 domain-containing protein [Acidimicrobiales bacterium]
MSSHREAPEISKDPVADSTDLYAFISPDAPSTVTLIANYVPLQPAEGGPNFFEFGDDVLYEILIDNDGDAVANIAFQFRFTTRVKNPNTFLYNTAPILSLNSSSWNRVQTYSVQRVDYPSGQATLLGENLPCPPCNIGPLSTPNYATSLAAPAIQSVGTGIQVFAGQRAEGFYVDLGSIFDLGILRPLANLHNTFGVGAPLSAMAGINATAGLNVHSIALQIPITEITRNQSVPSNPALATSCIGVWTTASRRRVRIYEEAPGNNVTTGPFIQISRLGNPLVNEVVIPMAQKDFWNTQQPDGDAQFVTNYSNPELAQLLPVLYTPDGGTTVFPNLANYNAGSPNRADIVAILLTGIPAGVVSPTYSTFTGATQADMLRLNLAIPPVPNSGGQLVGNNLGALGGDLAGFPNGRRVFDDVSTSRSRRWRERSWVWSTRAMWPTVRSAISPRA